MQLDWMFAAMLLAVSSLTALGSMVLLSLRIAPSGTAGRPPAAFAEEQHAVLLFDDEVLVDASASGRRLLAEAPQGIDDRAAVLAVLGPHFSGLGDAMARVEAAGQITLTGQGEAGLTLNLEWRGGLVRMTLRDAEGAASTNMDGLSLRAMEDELTSLRATTEHLPALVWRQGGDGAVIWANAAYTTLAQGRSGTDGPQTWPLPALFAADALPDSAIATRRVMLPPKSSEPPTWFDCHTYDLGADRLFVAMPADAVVRAEKKLRDFTQTLTKTFADLSIGLAVFDRQRRLATFNPALTDLVALGIDFLSARPTLLSFLDRLRENRRMPEPKDYRSWRQQMAALEDAAANGHYGEIWSLPTGETFKVTGRPHPDGALALLFEDISAETTLTRRYRTRIDLTQAALDTLPEAVAVFSVDGVMECTNAAYGRLWGNGSAPGILDALRHWQQGCRAEGFWADVPDFVTEAGDRQEWQDETALTDGRLLHCRFVPLPGGATMIGFSIPEARRKPMRLVLRHRSGGNTMDTQDENELPLLLTRTV